MEHGNGTNKKSWKVAALYAGAVALLVVAVVLVFAVVVNGRVLPGTSVDGVEVGFKTSADAEAELARIVAEYESRPLELTLDGSPSTGTLAEFGISIDHERTLEELRERVFSWGSGNPFVAGVKALRPDDVRAIVSIDTTVAGAAISELTSSRTTSPVDAELVVEDGIVSVTPEQTGFGFEVSLVQAMLVHHVSQLDPLPLALTSEQIPPRVTAAQLEPARVHAASFVAQPIVLSAADKTMRVQAKELGTWISVDSETSAIVADEEAVQRTIARFAEDVDGDPVPKIVVTGTDYVIDPGKDGHGIDRAAALTALVALVMAPEPARAVTLVTSTLAAPLREVGSLGAPSTDQGKEIVVVLSEQRLYAWDGGHLDKTYLISSGSTFPTHLGTFAVYNKIVSHTMAGADYNLPGVPHSMYYDGPRALHGAYWHSNFGYPMSHGCINEPLPEAEWLYDWTPMGTTVRVVQ